MRTHTGVGAGQALRGIARGLVLALGLCVTPQAQRPAAPDTFAQVLAAFEQPYSTAELRRRLGALDSSAIPHLFLLAATGNLPGPDGGSSALSPDDRVTLRESLAARPRRELVSFLDELAGRTQDQGFRLEAQRLLGTVGTADHLKLLVRLTLPPQPGPNPSHALRVGFNQALTEILARTPASVSQIPRLLAESAPILGAPIVEAMASIRGPQTTRILADLLGRTPGLDALLLARLAERGRLEAGAGRPVFESVRRYFQQRDPMLIVAAIRAAGRLGDDDSVEPLIAFMEHEDERIKASAFEALATITGLSIGPDPVRWSRWYHEEMRWWDTEAETRLISIERGANLEFVRASREALEHRLYRDRIAASFATALGRANPEEIRLACSALERLGSTVAVPALTACLNSEDPEVRRAAHAALRAITGLDLPPESDSWSEAAG